MILNTYSVIRIKIAYSNPMIFYNQMCKIYPKLVTPLNLPQSVSIISFPLLLVKYRCIHCYWSLGVTSDNTVKKEKNKIKGLKFVYHKYVLSVINTNHVFNDGLSRFIFTKIVRDHFDKLHFVMQHHDRHFGLFTDTTRNRYIWRDGNVSFYLGP